MNDAKQPLGLEGFVVGKASLRERHAIIAYLQASIEKQDFTGYNAWHYLGFLAPGSQQLSQKLHPTVTPRPPP